MAPNHYPSPITDPTLNSGGTEAQAPTQHQVTLMETKLKTDFALDLESEFESIASAAHNLVNVAKNAALSHPDLLPEITEITLSRSLHGKALPDRMGKGSPDDDYNKLSRFVALYTLDPTLAETLVDRNVAGFHGSRSGSLLSVLQHGLLPAAEARRRDDVKLVTGERTFSEEAGQRTVSFADWGQPTTIAEYAGVDAHPLSVEILERYKTETLQAVTTATETWGPDHFFSKNAAQAARDYEDQIKFLTAEPDTEQARLMLENFPVAYGVDISSYERVETVHDIPATELATPTVDRLIERVPSSKAGEFMIAAKVITSDKIAIIGVPELYVSYTQLLLTHFGHAATKVVPLSLLTANQPPLAA